MNHIQIFALITMSMFPLLKIVSANPVSNSDISKRSTNGTLGDAASSDPPSECDTAYPYCCNSPLYSPSILDLFIELNTVIDVLNKSCTNTTFKDNPPLKETPFTLDENDEDLQNEFLNGAFEFHMAIEGRKKELCIIEEEKFYRGETSMIEKCNLGCAVTNVEKQIVLYLQANKCGCRKNGKIRCEYFATPRNENIQCRGDCSSLGMVTCHLWDSFNFMQQIIAEMWFLRRHS